MPEEARKPVVEIQEEPEKSQEVHEVDTQPVSPAPRLSAEDQLAAKIRDDFQKLYGSRVEELTNGFRSIQRLNTKLQQEVEALRKAPPATKPVESADPWTTIQDGQVWKSEIERLAEEKAKSLLAQQESLRSAQEELVKQDAIRERWKQEVILRYPDLGPDGDSSSAVSATFNEVLNEHPEYLKDPFGPRLAMLDMKEKFQANGLSDPDTKLHPGSPTQNQELARRNRATASSTLPSRTNVPLPTKVVLSKDEMEFCTYHKIDPVVFARNKQVMESNGSLEVS